MNDTASFSGKVSSYKVEHIVIFLVGTSQLFARINVPYYRLLRFNPRERVTMSLIKVCTFPKVLESNCVGIYLMKLC